MRQNNKEDVPSKNTFKVGMLGKIEEKVKKERIREGHGGARGEVEGWGGGGGGSGAEKLRRCRL